MLTKIVAQAQDQIKYFYFKKLSGDIQLFMQPEGCYAPVMIEDFVKMDTYTVVHHEICT